MVTGNKTNELSDEEYLVQKAKETAITDTFRSKAWTLTAKTLFPKNFDIQFEAYLIEKKNGNSKDAANSFSSLFQTFVSESGLWEETCALTNALRAENPTSDEMFLREMFTFMPTMTQHDILTVTAERSEDTMEHCRLMLLLFKKFPQSTPHLIIRLVDTLVTAEKHGHSPSVINCYRKTLVCEVLPLLLNSSADITLKQLYRFLHKSIEFYLAYLMAKPSTVENLLEKENKTDISWESLFNLLKTFGTKLEWKLCSIFNPPWNRDVAWQEIHNSVRDNTLDTRQIVYCLTTLFVYNLYHYNMAVNPVSEGKHSVLLVEAFVKKDPEDVLTLPPKKMKLDTNVVDTSRPFLSCGEGVGDVIKYFNCTYSCYNTLNATESYQKEFSKVKQYIKLDTWLLDFVTDVALYQNKIEEYQINVQLNSVNNIRTLLQKLTYNYTIKNYHIMWETCMLVMKQLDSLTRLGNLSSALTENNVLRHLHFLPIAKIPVLQYVVKLLIITYWQLLPNFTGLDIDRIYGCLLILCQMSWPSEKGIITEILKRIRVQRSFTCPLFFKYVINLELLEEFMYMYVNEQELIKLDLMGGCQTPNTKRMSTRGADKEVREDFRHMMKQQVCRQEPLYILIIQFLLEEEKYLVLK